MTVSTGASGRFISFEGIDGAGKSSHIEPLAALLRQQGRRVTVSREPGGTPLAEQLRALLLAQPMDALTEALLVFAARRDHLRQCLLPALQRGEVVLCDRFTDASFAYQGSGRGLDMQVLAQLERWVQAREGAGVQPQEGAPVPLHQPDLTFWFDLPAAQAAQRLAAARGTDRFESEPDVFFRRVAQGYRARAEADPQRFVRIDASRDRHAVWQQIVAALVQRGWLAIAVAAQGHHGTT